VTSFLFIGIAGITFLLILFKKNPALEGSAANQRMANTLRNAPWFQSQWKAGLFLFFSNALLFFAALLGLYFLLFLNIPYVHLLIMFLATAISIHLWMVMKLAWAGSKKGRIQMSLIGSSFYLFVFIIFLYQYFSVQPEFPGDDPFMRAIGFFFGMIVSATASVVCIMTIGFSSKTK
jgi:hypothetical protein